MKTFVLNSGRYDGNGLDTLALLPEFRRSTFNMQMAYLAIKNTIAPYEKEFAQIADRCALVVGTSHGELLATADFLGEFHKSKTARPLLFQSSLHNATLGFLSIQFKLAAAGITVSDGYFSGECALREAQTLISSGMADFAIAVGVDGLVPKLTPAVESMYELLPNLVQGSAALFLAGEAGLKQFSELRPKAVLKSIDCQWNHSGNRVADNFDAEKPYYDSNAIELLGKALLTGSSLKLIKPNGSCSHIHYEGM